jgi:putative CocE/NonD family hydrolase
MNLDPAERQQERAEILSSVTRLRRYVSGWPIRGMTLFEREGLAPYFTDWLARPDYDETWGRINISAHHDRITVPAFNLGSWYDLFIAGPPRNFVGLQKNAANETARGGQRLLIGPWTHNSPSVSTAGQRDFGHGATLVLEDLQLRWFNHWLKGIDTGFMSEPPVRLYVMNDGWRDEHEWPLARTEYTKYYLHSSGRALSRHGDGSLSTRAPKGDETPDTFLSNPLNPVGTIGAAGVNDQRPAEERTDVLVYTTPPLTEPVEVTGPVRLVLSASTSAADTDWVARLIDVTPDGYAANLCDGILRARYRNSRTQGELLQPGTVYQFEVDMLMTSNLFPAGHRIRLEIASSCFPKFDRNAHTTTHPSEEGDPQVAVQKVFHDAARPSYLVLPVIPRR